MKDSELFDQSTTDSADLHRRKWAFSGHPAPPFHLRRRNRQRRLGRRPPIERHTRRPRRYVPLSSRQFLHRLLHARPNQRHDARGSPRGFADHCLATCKQRRHAHPSRNHLRRIIRRIRVSHRRARHSPRRRGGRRPPYRHGPHGLLAWCARGPAHIRRRPSRHWLVLCRWNLRRYVRFLFPFSSNPFGFSNHPSWLIFCTDCADPWVFFFLLKYSGSTSMVAVVLLALSRFLILGRWRGTV